MAKVSITFDNKRALAWLHNLHGRTQNVLFAKRDYIETIAAFVFQDVIDHFDKEKGPSGGWQEWSKAYSKHMTKIGKSGNKILQDNGNLRQSFKPTNWRRQRNSILWFNDAKTKSGAPYAVIHDEGLGPQPKRNFMWLSKDAENAISEATAAYVTKDLNK